jgi:hypothetical protein
MAPTVDTVAHLPSLSLPLQGGDVGTRVSAPVSAPPHSPRLAVSPFLQVSTSSSLPLIDSSAPPTTRPPSQRHEHTLHSSTTKPFRLSVSSSRRLSIPSSCPSPSGEGTQALACGSEPSKGQAPCRSQGLAGASPSAGKKGPTEEIAPTDDLVAHLLILSVPGSGSGVGPLRGEDVGPAASTGASVLVFDEVPGLPSVSPLERRLRGVERKWHQSSIPLPIYPPCPSLSREGTWGHASRLR